MGHFQLDEVDRAILQKLLEDSRKSYQEIARELIVSGGTIHVRINKMREAGIIRGSKIIVDYSELGLGVCSFIGLNLNRASDYQSVLEKLKKFPQVVEVHYTTGQYSLFIKVFGKNTHELHMFLINQLQSIEEIHSTETFIALDTPIQRDPEIPVN